MTENEKNPQKTVSPQPALGEESNRKIPSWFWLLSFIILSGVVYILVFETGGWRSTVFDTTSLFWGYMPKEKPKEKVLQKTQPVAADPMAIGQEQYQAMCSACHQPSGMGMAGQYPPLANSEYVIGSKARLAAILLNGLSGELKINGQTYNGVMPGWKTALNDEKLAAVMTYIRNSWGNHGDKVEANEVKQFREKYGKKEEAWKPSELSTLGE
ncbi:cytochrome c [Candidatus Methylacidiphilum fumarolicum]|uniref:Cytochrome c family protein n=2 Tax=Candidatus Methylacidiphilum fumarolicum TaxID=591154 RepID=I0JZ51_METFB|nr:cytochrome c [Candidatus Methylacidiphilum fumarolicum]MBW6414676.1 cytochrome c [Candidatus Methylacidiphilum fumarolicum]TFE70186.1 cytochrome C [Candidatus Methylacidiphilum fumarolicum]TFE74248.1 cytochrome c [Candidatus Methylacidiphilum fumarolicum]TFE75747.1 cytochrome c [Candidatus Methylacidiphilum fumarolicum]TFE75905.1 cytochrome C [Candidatus Methylacidiphilum fumarolicum]